MVYQVIQDFRDNQDRLDHWACPVTRDLLERLDSPAAPDQWEPREVLALLDLKDHPAFRVDPVGPVVLDHPVPLDFRDLRDHLETLDNQDFQDHPVLVDNPVI